MSSNNSNSQNEINVLPFRENANNSLDQALSTMAEGTTLKFSSGEYQIMQPIRIDKSVRIVGEGIGNTIISGENLNVLLESTGSHSIELEGISFVNHNNSMDSLVIVSGGNLQVKDCAFSLAKGDEKISGTGLKILGGATFKITGSVIEQNHEMGILVQGNCKGDIHTTTFRDNYVGIGAIENSQVRIFDCEFTNNYLGIVFENNSIGIIQENSFAENRTAALLKGNSNSILFKNKFTDNEVSIITGENCDCKIEENEISNCQIGILASQNTKAIIINNLINSNEQGIICDDQSNTQISKNRFLHQEKFGVLFKAKSVTQVEENTINENFAAIKFSENVKFSFSNNLVIGNSGYGVLAKTNSRGTITKNVVKNNGNWNVQIEEGAIVEFDDYKEPKAQANPVHYAEALGQISISAPSAGEIVCFKEVIARSKPDQEICLEEGDYEVSEPIMIDQPLKIYGSFIDKVRIIAEDLPNLLSFQGNGTLELKNIEFVLKSSLQTNVIIISSGELDMEDCVISGGNDPQFQRCDHGAGILLNENCKADIRQSVFKKNTLGISAQGQSTVALTSNTFEGNGYGAIFRDRSTGEIFNNEFCSNEGYGLMAYDQSTVTVTENSSHHNAAGIGLLHQVKANLENNEVFGNEQHGIFIDNNVVCRLSKNKSYENQNNGLATYGASQTNAEENEFFDNEIRGVEIGENASLTLKGNKIYNNDRSGILICDSATAQIELNEIYDNNIGIEIIDEAKASIVRNKIHQNFRGTVSDKSQNKSTLRENELFDYIPGEQDEDLEDKEVKFSFAGFEDDGDGISLEELFSQMMGGDFSSDAEGDEDSD